MAWWALGAGRCPERFLTVTVGVAQRWAALTLTIGTIKVHPKTIVDTCRHVTRG
jgi:hypothetical protein